MDKTEEIRAQIEKARNMAKDHAREATDPKCAALCETTAEVLAGLATAYKDYQEKSEEAWQ